MGLILAYGSLDYIYLLNFSNKEILISGVFVVIAAITKSAQIPFSS
jgi:NADH:ubiquinone oxidoreductase subunit 5 (subunit L)/multisubunit Na+/H+ antiporter MnhA subunit